MATINQTQELVHMITQLDHRLERIEVGMQEIKEEIGLEIRPEYLKKLKSIQKEKGKEFKTKEEFLSYVKHEL